MPMPPTEALSDWIGRTETVSDTITAVPYAALCATLDYPARTPQAGTVLPPLWHWLYFLPLHPASELGEDGHARRGGFLPPVAKPRRMWAGGKLSFHAPLRVGDAVERRSTVLDVQSRKGRSGELVFVAVQHEIFAGHGRDLALVERHDIVYRDPPAAGSAPGGDPQPAPAESAWRETIVPGDVLLFRYSALTFNSHRIHYDRRYVTGAEGYPGLVVHGPLIATLLLELLRKNLPQARVSEFEFRAVRPTFDGQAFSLHGEPEPGGRRVRLWARDHEGWLTMQASAMLAEPAAQGEGA